MSTVHRCIDFASLFEAELLTELMLRCWNHPFADDADYRNDLLEKATEALQHAAAGGQLFGSLPASNMNFVAAVWYAESIAMPESESEDAPDIHQRRKEWLQQVRLACPECFGDEGT